MALVDQLDHPQQVFLEQDGHCEYRLGPESGLLVPALIEAQIGVELRQLGGVVGIFDVDGLAGQGGKSGNGRERLRNADLFRNVTDLLE